ncbi:DNA repair protein RecN [Pullulanibacillus sp. KACC 23026]|uniref:DNA repair protein RecN n=1 Tax=Pullulanibacillus sp. KACC 23026 TaxID=3028315 RepID=UPI0023B0CE2B|nr:DNA repair protein RecN [Pullulanibacillus sp. KACC 23026]WEG14324.1 DNA repair protein RecN [Pullulanibacillus sp. KACC 23026]
MLAELRIENFAIIEKLTISFNQGLTVITGETGAGKSIIIDAISLLVGGRGSSEYVRHGTEQADIEALFEIPSDPEHSLNVILKEFGIDVQDDMIILRRTIHKNGKSICRVNGRLVTISQIREIGQYLIDVHGQHEHQELMVADLHIKLLDRMGGEHLETVKKTYTELYDKALAIQKEIEKWSKNEQEAAARLDLLGFQIQEIEAAHLDPEEEPQLLEERQRFANFEKLFKGLNRSYGALNDDHRTLDSFREALFEMETLMGLDAHLDTIYENMSNSFYLLEEQVHQLSQYIDELEYDPSRVDLVEARLDELNHLKRKYGRTIEEVLSYYEDIKKEFDQLTDRDLTIGNLEKQYKELLLSLNQAGDALTKIRQEEAERLDEAINRELKDLYMEKASFKVSIQPIEVTEDIRTFSRHGKERVEFLITTNPGEPLKPLSKIASGGELSRIMLAIKSHFKSYRGTTSIIFDEVDTGVSGRVAQAMGEKIYALSKGSQVFCITHLPQVASMADSHLYISKEVSDNRTTTSVSELKGEEQVAELARMISGVEMTDLTKQHAKELLELAYKRKRE